MNPLRSISAFAYILLLSACGLAPAARAQAAPQSATAVTPRSFTLDYQVQPPSQRFWAQVSPRIWIEAFSTGEVKTHAVVARLGGVVPGTIVLSDSNLYVLIPDVLPNQRAMAYFRLGASAPWQPLASLHKVNQTTLPDTPAVRAALARVPNSSWIAAFVQPNFALAYAVAHPDAQPVVVAQAPARPAPLAPRPMPAAAPAPVAAATIATTATPPSATSVAAPAPAPRPTVAVAPPPPPPPPPPPVNPRDVRPQWLAYVSDGGHNYFWALRPTSTEATQLAQANCARRHGAACQIHALCELAGDAPNAAWFAAARGNGSVYLACGFAAKSAAVSDALGRCRAAAGAACASEGADVVGWDNARVIALRRDEQLREQAEARARAHQQQLEAAKQKILAGAQQQDAGDEFALAQIYLNEWSFDGEHVATQPDAAQALYWLTQAAKDKHGPPEAKCRLGRLYQLGQGVPPDFQQAAQWYEKAYKDNSALGAYRLARMYEQGEGFPQSDKKALEWYRKGAELFGADGAKCALKMAQLDRSGHGPDEDAKLSQAWIRRAAADGSPEAEEQVQMPPALIQGLAGGERFANSDYVRWLAGDGLLSADSKAMYARMQAAERKGEAYKALYFARLLTTLRPKLRAAWVDRARLAGALQLQDEMSASLAHAQDTAAADAVPGGILPGQGLAAQPVDLQDWAAALALLSDDLSWKIGPHATAAVADDLYGLDFVRDPDSPYATAKPLLATLLPPNLFALDTGDISAMQPKKGHGGLLRMAGIGGMLLATAGATNSDPVTQMQAGQLAQESGTLLGQGMAERSRFAGGSYQAVLFDHEYPQTTARRPQPAGGAHAVGLPLPVLWASGGSMRPYIDANFTDSNGSGGPPASVVRIEGRDSGDLRVSSGARPNDAAFLLFPKLAMLADGAGHQTVPLTVLEVMLNDDDLAALAAGKQFKLPDLSPFASAYARNQLQLIPGDGGFSPEFWAARGNRAAPTAATLSALMPGAVPNLHPEWNAGLLAFDPEGKIYLFLQTPDQWVY